MELIPAIDLLDNIVVKAFLGQRKKYKPINSESSFQGLMKNIKKFLLTRKNKKVIGIIHLHHCLSRGIK